MTAVDQQFGGLSCLVLCFKLGDRSGQQSGQSVPSPTVIQCWLSGVASTRVCRDLSILFEYYMFDIMELKNVLNHVTISPCTCGNTS